MDEETGAFLLRAMRILQKQNDTLWDELEKMDEAIKAATELILWNFRQGKLEQPPEGNVFIMRLANGRLGLNMEARNDDTD